MSDSLSTGLRLGFLGTGKISVAVASGFCSPGGWQPARVVVSPRNAAKAALLAAKFPDRVTVAGSNQEVVDQCDVVFIGLLPDTAEEILPHMRFRDDHTIISMMATKRHADVVRLVRLPEERVAVSVPLPTTATRDGPILLFPNLPLARQLYSCIGTPVMPPEEGQMQKLLPFTSLISPFYALLDACTKWATAAGADEHAAGAYVGSFFAALAKAGKTYPEGGFGEMAEEAATPSGLNEQTLRMLREAGVYDRFTDATDVILARIGGTPVKGGAQAAASAPPAAEE